MPKLDATHLVDRLSEQIEKLEGGKPLIVRDVKALLSQTALVKFQEAWAQQQSLRNRRRVKSDERAAVGVLTKRELYVAALKAELEVAGTNTSTAWKKKMEDANARQTRVYFDALNKAKADGKTEQAARNWANNELTRAGLRRTDSATPII